MAELTGARNRFIVAATVSTACSLIIRRPLAYAVAVGLGVMVADPDGMLKAMKGWKTTAEGGDTDEIERLAEWMVAFKDKLKTDAKWEGAAFTAMEAAADGFIEAIKELGTGRNGIGDTLKSSAELYDKLSWVALGLMSAMVVWAGLVLASRLTPGTWALSQIAINAGLKALWTSLRPILFKLAIFAGGVFAIYQGVSMKSMEQATKFQTMMAMPIEQYGLGNDTRTGALVPKTIPTDNQNGIDTKNGGLPSGRNIPGMPA
ncbi:hypothetical protein [Nonomuraea indica]|uniref:Type IV secretion system protein n=1 Tax=Nonomuraea indica TaxID=1581193 RepID=A0ABW8A353_9ACTN